MFLLRVDIRLVKGRLFSKRKARRTQELSAELSVTRGCWRKLFPPVCGVIFCDFRLACYERRIFNMLNNFVHEWTFPHSVRAFWAISSAINASAHAFFSCFTKVKMVANSPIVAEAVLEDKLADFWPDYPCFYDVRCPELKNRGLRDKAFQELAEKLETTCKRILNFSVKNSCWYCTRGFVTLLASVSFTTVKFWKPLHLRTSLSLNFRVVTKIFGGFMCSSVT